MALIDRFYYDAVLVLLQEKLFGASGISVSDPQSTDPLSK